MTGFDYLVLGVLAVSVLLGLWRGVVSEILALISWVVAFFVARSIGDSVAASLSEVIVSPALRLIVAYTGIFIGVLLLITLLRWLLSRLLSAAGLGVLDRLLGAGFGVLRGLVIVLAGVLLAGLTSLPSALWWRDSILAPPLETAVIAARPWMPQELARRIKYR